MEGIKIGDIVRMLRRRAVMIVSIVVVFSGLAAMVAYFIPPTYVATAKILIEGQQIPSQLASSTVTASINERLEVIRQRLMTRANLLDLVDRLDLYGERDDLSKTAKVNLIRGSTAIRKIRVQAGPRQTVVAAFTISYSDSNPQRAAQITNEFVTMVLEQNIRARSARASETHDFFKEEVAQVERELSRAEAELADFKIRNELALPSSLDYRRRELDSIRKARFERKGRILKLEEQRHELQTALDTGRYADAVGTALTQEQKDLEALRIELTRALSIYAESHYKVRSLRSRIEAMEEALSGTGNAAALESTADRAARIKAGIERQIKALDTELELLRTEETQAEERVAELERSIERTPEVALELGALNRRIEDLRIRFDQAIRKQAFAATGEKLEVNRQAERFEVIEQAQVPDRPTSPNREAIAIGGFAGSLGAAISLALLLGFLNSSIRTVGDLERKLEMRPLMTVPYITTDRERRRSRREIYLLLTLAFVIVPVALYAIDQYYLPLELLLENFVDRTGLRGIFNRIGGMIG